MLFRYFVDLVDGLYYYPYKIEFKSNEVLDRFLKNPSALQTLDDDEEVSVTGCLIIHDPRCRPIGTTIPPSSRCADVDKAISLIQQFWKVPAEILVKQPDGRRDVRLFDG